MEKGWLLAYSVNKIHLAEMAKQMLADHDIEALLINKRDSFYLFGDIELYVRRENILKAKLLIKKFEN